MKKKLVAVLLVCLMFATLAAPAFAAIGAGHPDFSREKLRAVVVGLTDDITGFISNLFTADAVKNMAKTAIMGMMNSSEITDLARPALAKLVEDALRGAAGNAIPDTMDVGAIVNDVLGSDIVANVLNSGFVGKVMDRTIDNLIAGLVVKDVIDALSAGVVDKLTDEIWNNGYTSSGTGTIPYVGIVYETGSWNTTGGWNTTNIGVTIAGRLAAAGGIGGYVDASKLDFARILGADSFVRALSKAVKDTAAEYYETYKPLVTARIQARLGEAMDKGKAAVVGELNRIFSLKLSALESLDSLEAILVKHIRDAKVSLSGNKDRIIRELKDLKVAIGIADKYVGVDLKKVGALLDRLIKCVEGDTEKPPVVEPTLPKILPSASVEKRSGNTNGLTITLTESFADGSTRKLAEKTFTISNNAAGTYEVGGYKVYVDTKGNTQIRACYIVE